MKDELMKLALDQAIEVEFDSWTLEQAGKKIDQMRSEYKERSDSILRGVLTLLLMGEVERQKPGTVQQLLHSVENAAKAMSPPKSNA